MISAVVTDYSCLGDQLMIILAAPPPSDIIGNRLYLKYRTEQLELFFFLNKSAIIQI